MVAWVRELHVRENGMRMDSYVEAVVEGITEGKELPHISKFFGIIILP